MSEVTTRQMDVQVGCVTTKGDELYYEVRGDGQPLLMIPGGGGDGRIYSFVGRKHKMSISIGIWKGFYRLVNPVLRFLVLSFGFDSQGDQDVMRILRVRGRKSGRVYDVPVRVATLDGKPYILSMLGESQWARNLRAAGEAQLIAGKTVEWIRAHEIQGKEKADFLSWYCNHPQYRLRARFGFKADIKHLTPTEVDRLARLYPVFRLELKPRTDT